MKCIYCDTELTQREHESDIDCIIALGRKIIELEERLTELEGANREGSDSPEPGSLAWDRRDP